MKERPACWDAGICRSNRRRRSSCCADGATVIDVRTPQEFADRHLDCAVNFPLENLANELDRLPAGALLVHCKSGMRSNMATRLLQSKGVKNVYNLGSFDRARSIVEVT